MLAPACAPRAGPNVTFRQWPRSACAGGCRPFVRPLGEIQRVDGVVLGTLGVLFCCLDIKLVAFAADAVPQVPHLRLGISLHRLPLALRPLGGSARLFAGRLPMGDICLDLLDARPNLLAGLLAGPIRGLLQFCDLLLQGLNVLPQPARLTNAHVPLRPYPRLSLATHSPGQAVATI
jgi:hypothetical protein